MSWWDLCAPKEFPLHCKQLDNHIWNLPLQKRERDQQPLIMSTKLKILWALKMLHYYYLVALHSFCRHISCSHFSPLKRNVRRTYLQNDFCDVIILKPISILLIYLNTWNMPSGYIFSITKLNMHQEDSIKHVVEKKPAVFVNLLKGSGKS